MILDEIARLDDIIKNLLNFARPVSPRPKDISLPHLIEEALALVSDKAAEQGVRLRFENLLRDDRCMLDGDQVKQVILNIALNGIEACDAGGVVSVFAREAANAGIHRNRARRYRVPAYPETSRTGCTIRSSRRNRRGPGWDFRSRGR